MEINETALDAEEQDLERKLAALREKRKLLAEQKLAEEKAEQERLAEEAIKLAEEAEVKQQEYLKENSHSIEWDEWRLHHQLLIPEVVEYNSENVPVPYKAQAEVIWEECIWRFDYHEPYIYISMTRKPTRYGYWESDFNFNIQQYCGEALHKDGKLKYPGSAEIFSKLLQSPLNDGQHYKVAEYSANYKKTYEALIEWTPAFYFGCYETIQASMKHYEYLEQLRKLSIENVDKFGPLPIEVKDPVPFANQKIGLHYTSKIMPFALLWEMGTGKTRTAIETFIMYHKRGEVEKCLVVCPLSVMDNWENEIAKWSDYSCEILKGTKQDKLDILANSTSEFIIINYESIRPLEEPLEFWIDSATMIIADETTKIKNPNAKRSKAIVKLGMVTKYKIIMTGTPVTQHGYDLFNQYLFLDGGTTFGLKYDTFIDKYYWRQGYGCIPKGGALDNLSNLAYTKALRFLKKDCLDIPDKMYISRVVELPEYNKKKYDEMRDFAITQIENSEHVTAAIILVQLLRLSQITSGFVKDEMGNEIDFEENPKLDELKEIMEEVEGKCVIWCRFIHDVKRIKQMLTEMEISCCELHGEIDNETRQKNIRDFQDINNGCRVIIGTAQTGGLGINLVSAHTVIYYSNSYSLQDRLQSEDRTHRAGQTEKVTYIDLLAKNTIDVSINKILRNKKDVADIITKDNLRQLL